MAFWAQAAREVVEVERQLHATHVTDLTAAEPSPTTVAYTSYLLSLATAGNYPVLAAGILPCFWVYDDVGTRLKAAVGDLSTHPYGDWIATYGDPDFTAATDTARDIVDHLADQASPAHWRACTPRSTAPPSTSGCSGTPPTGRRPGPSEVIGRCALGRALIMIFRELVAALETPTVRWCCSDGGRPDPGLIKVNGALRPVLRTRSASAFDTMRPEGDASYQSMSPVSPERASVSHRGCMGSNGAGSSSGEKKPACEVSTPSGCI